MTSKLSVIVHVDMDGYHVRVAVTGCLTVTNQQGLHPVIDHACRLTSEVTVVVDLTATDCPHPHAVAQLHHSIDNAAGPPRPVTILAPTTPLAPNSARGAHRIPPYVSAQGPEPRPTSAAPQCSHHTAREPAGPL